MDSLNVVDTTGLYPSDSFFTNDGQAASWSRALAAAKMQAAQVTNDEDQTRDTHSTQNPGDTVLMPPDDDGGTPPTALPAQSGFWSTLRFGACVAGQTALGSLKGLVVGGAAGTAGGFVDGMTGGAIIGTFIEPGGGTIALGGAGAVGGAVASGVAGGFLGSAVGAATGAHQGLEYCGAASGAPSPQGPTVMEARAQPPIKSVAPPKGSPPGTKSYEIGKNKITLTPQPGGTYKAEFIIKQDFGDVERSGATKAAGAKARANGVPGDVGFHTVGHRFFPGVTETLAPGNGSLNLSAYKAMENDIASQVKLGNTVSGSIQPLPPTAARPDAFRLMGQVLKPDGTVADQLRQRFLNRAP